MATSVTVIGGLVLVVVGKVVVFKTTLVTVDLGAVGAAAYTVTRLPWIIVEL